MALDIGYRLVVAASHLLDLPDEGKVAVKKTTCLSAMAFIVLGSAAPVVALAETLVKANQKDVSMLLDAATGMNSGYLAVLVGEIHDRVYFEYSTGLHAGSSFTNRPKRVVYWGTDSRNHGEAAGAVQSLQRQGVAWEVKGLN